MLAKRLLILVATAAAAAGSVAADFALPDTSAATTAQLLPPTTNNLETSSPTFSTGSIGLKSPSARITESTGLPYGLNYSGETKSLLLPIDPKSNWGVGLNLDVNASRAVELAPPTPLLGLQPKRTPGVTLQMKF